VHSLSVASEPLAIWNKKLKGLENSGLKNLKIFPEDMYPAAPKPIFGFICRKNSNIGPFCCILRYSVCLSEVGGRWPLCGKCSAVTGCTVLEYSSRYVVRVYCVFTCGLFDFIALLLFLVIVRLNLLMNLVHVHRF
jgi:hypothetical protein